MAKSNYRGSFGLRKRFKGRRVLPTGVPRSSNGTAKLAGKTIKGGKGVCKPSGSVQKSAKFECGGGNVRITKVGKSPGTGRWVSMPRNCIRYIESLG